MHPLSSLQLITFANLSQDVLVDREECKVLIC